MNPELEKFITWVEKQGYSQTDKNLLVGAYAFYVGEKTKTRSGERLLTVVFRAEASVPDPSKMEYSKNTETLTLWFPDDFGDVSGQQFKLIRSGGIPLPEESDLPNQDPHES